MICQHPIADQRVSPCGHIRAHNACVRAFWGKTARTREHSSNLIPFPSCRRNSHALTREFHSLPLSGPVPDKKARLGFAL